MNKEQEVLEALRKSILWAECVAMKLSGDQRQDLNWKYLNEAKVVYDKYAKEDK